MAHPLFRHAEFFTTVNHLRDLPQTHGVEIAFVGRSNAGKSSAINTLVGKGRFAFVSKTPGRTQHINFFKLRERYFLVDLPGYGYAKVPQAMRKHWANLLSTYLQTRQALYGMILIMDIRHPLTKLDLQMLEWFAQTGKPVHVLLSKADKLSRGKALAVLHDVRRFLSAEYTDCTVQTFSSLAIEGVEEAENRLQEWFAAGEAQIEQQQIIEKNSPG